MIDKTAGTPVQEKSKYTIPIFHSPKTNLCKPNTPKIKASIPATLIFTKYLFSFLMSIMSPQSQIVITFLLSKHYNCFMKIAQSQAIFLYNL